MPNAALFAIPLMRAQTARSNDRPEADTLILVCAANGAETWQVKLHVQNINILRLDIVRDKRGIDYHITNIL
jgi:hypothetical protein